jgi:tetratricopeptide (TPR) repeat protein
MRVLLCSLWIGVALAALAPRRAAGQSASERASQYVDAGIAAQRRGEYDAAIAFYKQAYQLVPHPVLIFDMAQAHRLAGHVDQARGLYARYLALDPDGSEANVARQLIAELGAGTTSTARADDTAEPARAADAALPPDPAQPGSAIARGPAPGEPGALGRVASSPSEPPVPGTQPRPAAGSHVPVVTAEGGDDAPRSAGRLTGQRKLAIGVAAAAAAAGATGLVFGMLAQQRQHDAFALCPDPAMPCAGARSADALIDSARRQALVADLAFGVAAAAAIGAGVLWFTGAPGGERGRRLDLVPSLAPGAVGVVLQGGF